MTEPPKMEDLDPVETREWLESIDSVLKTHGPQRAHYLLERLIDYTRRSGAYLPFRPNTAYVNTIAAGREPDYPGNRALEQRIEAYIRWNALAMVLAANRASSEYGGHLASYASSATLYEVGFNHVWRAPSSSHPGDMVFIQGHSSPGIYARAYLEGRLNEEQLQFFRQEARAPGVGLSSYPHPWLMPDFWQFPTVSMGLGAMMAIFQARFTRYLEHRGLVPASDRKVWVFLGDGEMDEPESMGALTMPVREGLDNLIFVINCNLQRLDGPVRGNGKIIQELESAFLGAGWNVIKVLWGSRWDPLLARDHLGLLRRVMEECVDGEYQNFKAKGGAYTREHFFGKYPELKAMVANMSDDEIWRLNRGGHDARKVYAAYAAAMAHKGQPTVILAKTVKGFGLGKGGEGQMVAHQQKKLSEEDLKIFRDRFNIPVDDADIAGLPFRKPGEDAEETRYLRERRAGLGGFLPARRRTAPALEVPPLEAFATILEGTGEREISTTMAFVRILTVLLKDKGIGKHVVPIVPDEARTFGMEGLFRQIGIYSSVGQLYTPQDAETLMSYREDKKGQMLEEGINEAGSLCSWIAAGTAYSNHGINMVPFYIFYSMFGFQRVGDFIWAAGDIQSRGFLIGATAGRTTLAGEGLQHQDGHSQLVASTVPNCVGYDPAYAYELAVIIHDGLRRMYAEQQNIFYYITVMNENYAQPPMPEGAAPGILRGGYRLQAGGRGKVRATLLGSGTILRECLAAAKLLEEQFKIPADVYSITSFSELRREALECERWNLLHPGEKARVPYVQALLAEQAGPVVAATDYMRTVPDQIRQWVRGRYVVLGTDGFGRSDARAELRRFFEVDRQHIAVAALKALADEGQVDRASVARAIESLGVQPDKPVPWKV
ncbi:MAG: pyruvate dehydrogenase (acetyl-transferring), homodimeric type [Gammaproteobacteria bacterium]|nr:pyruvate dehydrogenase (acetyl-transferring), homodimeric type [Gammaproteobacteria bacterium]MBV9619841.1 pyruvate dehydrogenase (acetyl-transferring), homodimeric type [Gammaproteobacteria bacterium]